MKIIEKFKEKLIDRVVELFVIALSTALIWVCTKIGPVILPAVESGLSKEVIFTLLLSSLALNFIILVTFWAVHRKPEFKLKYGIYWDSEKNPHCPNCRIPIGSYDKYDVGWGYYCKPCKKIFQLTDATGKKIEPQQAISEL